MTMSSKVYYLQQLSLSQLSAKPMNEHLSVQEIIEQQAQKSREFYIAVGQNWQWNDKLAWSEQQWLDYIESNQLRTFGAYIKGLLAGYFELHKHSDNSVEIAYFGLTADYLGQGLGGDLLTRCLQTAWQWQANKVWVHTCDLDHPSALANYQARGMSLYQTILEH